MSTAIGQAFRFHDGLNLEAAIETCWALRPKAQKAQQDHLAKEFARIIEQELTNIFRFNHKPKQTPIQIALVSWREFKKGQDRDYKVMLWDTTFEVSLYRIEDAGQTIILGKSNTGQCHFHNLIMRNLPVRDYCYQNQTDKPSHISNRDWGERSRHWNLALPGLGIPSDHGIMVNLGYSEPPYPEIKKILSFLRTDQIIERQAKKIIFADRISAVAAAKPTAKGPFSLKSVMSRTNEVREWLAGPEGQAELEAEKKRLSRCFPAKITKDHI